MKIPSEDRKAFFSQKGSLPADDKAQVTQALIQAHLAAPVHLSEEALEWHDLGEGGFGIYQRPDGLRFGSDAVLLARLAPVSPYDVVYDLCSGMGIVAFLLAARHPSARVVGLELQPALVAMAEASRRRNGVSCERLSFRQSDVRTPEKDLVRTADVVVANPPYYVPGCGAPAEQVERALARHEYTLNLEELMCTAAAYLRQRGRLVIIHLAERVPELFAAACRHHLTPTSLTPIYSRAQVPARLVVVSFCFEGRQSLSIEPAVVLYADDGTPLPYPSHHSEEGKNSSSNGISS